MKKKVSNRKNAIDYWFYVKCKVLIAKTLDLVAIFDVQSQSGQPKSNQCRIVWKRWHRVWLGASGSTISRFWSFSADFDRQNQNDVSSPSLSKQNWTDDVTRASHRLEPALCWALIGPRLSVRSITRKLRSRKLVPLSLHPSSNER